MADQFNEFDRVFRDRLRDQTATPPDSVWNNIQAERTFGHIIANKISSTWRIIGTLLLLAMAGGTSAFLMSQDETSPVPDKTAYIEQNELDSPLQDPKTETRIFTTTLTNYKAEEIARHRKENKVIETSVEEEQLNIESDLLASNSDFGFGRPEFGDSKLAIFLDEMDGWGSAKPASKIHFYHLSSLDKKEMNGPVLVKSPMMPEGRWEYVIETVPKKSFKERLSAQFYIGPQFINKILTPEYNMETEFLEKRLETENTRLAYTAGMNFQYELKKNKFFETGIQFTQIYEEVRIDGDMRFSNQYDFVEIPLLIGYQDRESKWGWSIKGGLGVQVYNNYKGYILKKVEDRIALPVDVNPDPGSQYRISGNNVVRNIVQNEHTLSDKQDRNEVYYLSSDENPYKTSGVINVHMAAGVTYYHSIKTSFSVTPYYRQSVNSITKESANFNERISYMGILFGTKVNF